MGTIPRHELVAENKRLRDQIEGLLHDPCDVCTGEGTPLSGGKCICDGTGKGTDEKVGLRTEIHRLRRALRGEDDAAAEAIADKLPNQGWGDRHLRIRMARSLLRHAGRALGVK